MKKSKTPEAILDQMIEFLDILTPVEDLPEETVRKYDRKARAARRLK